MNGCAESGGAESPIVLTAAGARDGARRMAPIALFVLPFGLAFGAAAVAAGLSPEAAVGMSALVFAGAAQFAGLELWSDPPPLMSLALVALAVNARLAVMGAALAPWLNALSLGRRLLALASLTDANFADGRAALRDGARDAGVLAGGGAALWLAWVSGTAAGAYAGASIGALEAFGLDLVMAAFFAAAVTGGLRSGGPVAPVVAGAAVAVATREVLPSGWHLIAAALAGGAVAALPSERRR